MLVETSTMFSLIVLVLSLELSNSAKIVRSIMFTASLTERCVKFFYIYFILVVAAEFAIPCVVRPADLAGILEHLLSG